jgi:hypothetical protein
MVRRSCIGGLSERSSLRFLAPLFRTHEILKKATEKLNPRSQRDKSGVLPKILHCDQFAQNQPILACSQLELYSKSCVCVEIATFKTNGSRYVDLVFDCFPKRTEVPVDLEELLEAENMKPPRKTLRAMQPVYDHILKAFEASSKKTYTRISRITPARLRGGVGSLSRCITLDKPIVRTVAAIAF